MRFGGESAGSAPRSHTICKFDHIYFAREKSATLGSLGVPYPDEYFLVTSSDPSGVTCVGSMGGRVTVGWDDPVIRSVSPQHMGEPFVAPAGPVQSAGPLMVDPTGNLNESQSQAYDILWRCGLDTLPSQLLPKLVRYVRGNPGAATAAGTMLARAGVESIRTAKDIERVLGINLAAPDEELPVLQGKLWYRFKHE